MEMVWKTGGFTEAAHEFSQEEYGGQSQTFILDYVDQAGKTATA